MAWVLAALLPGIAVYVWVFGPGILVTLALATVTALAAEAAMLQARGYPANLSSRPVGHRHRLAAGALAAFAGAMVADRHRHAVCHRGRQAPVRRPRAEYLQSGDGRLRGADRVVPGADDAVGGPARTDFSPLTLAQSAAVIFGGDAPKTTLDAVTMATPLDSLRTGLLQQHTVDEIMAQPIFGHYGGIGFEWLAAAFLLGGLVLWALRIISWQVPLAFLAGIWLTAGFLHFFDAGRFGAPWFHLFAPSVMLGAFFIATDPVSGATTPRGKLIFGLGAGFLTIVIRTWGGYPDGVAFAILLMNLCVPLIDQYTQPRIYGDAKKIKVPPA